MYGKQDLNKREHLMQDTKMSGVETMTMQGHPEEMYRHAGSFQSPRASVHGNRHPDVETVIGERPMPGPMGMPKR